VSLQDRRALTPNHPCWDEFCDRLGGEEGCNFRGADSTWSCAGDLGQNRDSPERVHGFSRAILKKMGLSDQQIAESLAYFRDHGGYCDCEVLFNVSDAAA